MNPLVSVSLHQKAIFISQEELTGSDAPLRETTSILVANLAKLGFGVSEDLLNALNKIKPTFQLALLDKFGEVMGINQNWTPLVKGWDVPIGESITDHIITFFTNIFQAKGTRLACGHIIPENTFPLERYNGCPFCGTPFETNKLDLKGQGSKLKVLELWTGKEVYAFLEDLLASKTALDATQMDSLKILLQELPLPDAKIEMKETLMAVIHILIEQDKAQEVQVFFTSPTDILRYLWYKHTGFLQILEPKTIIKRKSKNSKHITPSLDAGASSKLKATEEIKLKYSRKECLMVATWLNNLEGDVQKIAETMHPKRGMWIRFIRALRLPEYSHRKGLEKLKVLLDVFYNKNYTVWQSRVNHFRLRSDAENTFKFLKQRPGLFARSLFANMLWFGADETIEAFSEVIDQVPARLVFTLNMYAENYFIKGKNRQVKPLGGVSKTIESNSLLKLYGDKELQKMKEGIEDLSLLAMRKRFEKQEVGAKTMYIDKMLYYMPVSIGDRSENVQDLPSALMGARFPVEGNIIRLFMQWGEGLPEQHLDMDLSCHIAYNPTNKGANSEICSYSNLVTTGCKHSGDIRSIPEKVGTAEYINIDLKKLQKAGAKYVTFTCNAYSNGAITPNLVLGWMDSKFPMEISTKTGVAYDPSCVQQQVRITYNLTKGLVFGVLDVEKSEIIWLEMSFQSQVVQGFSFAGVEALLDKLNSKLSIGNLLKIKAEAQNIEIVEELDEDNLADEIYDLKWASNSAAVTKLLID